MDQTSWPSESGEVIQKFPIPPTECLSSQSKILPSLAQVPDGLRHLSMNGEQLIIGAHNELISTTKRPVADCAATLESACQQVSYAQNNISFGIHTCLETLETIAVRCTSVGKSLSKTSATLSRQRELIMRFLERNSRKFQLLHDLALKRWAFYAWHTFRRDELRKSLEAVVLRLSALAKKEHELRVMQQCFSVWCRAISTEHRKRRELLKGALVEREQEILLMASGLTRTSSARRTLTPDWQSSAVRQKAVNYNRFKTR